MKEIQQSKPYAAYITSLGWKVIINDGQYYFMKKLPFIGTLLKVQRITHLPDLKTFKRILIENRVNKLVVEPDSRIAEPEFKKWVARLPKNIHVETEPYIPTKTIRVDVKFDEQTIFNHLSEAKRRAVRRAQKHMVTVTASQDIRTFVRVKNRAAGFLGFITTYGLDKLWANLPAENRVVILASVADGQESRVVGGIFLIFWNKLAYYWVAGATREGKKLFAPTLLVWEALRLAKIHNCTALDFVGVWDERHPDKNHEWKGFTKFKEGFGGKTIYYPLFY